MHTEQAQTPPTIEEPRIVALLWKAALLVSAALALLFLISLTLRVNNFRQLSENIDPLSYLISIDLLELCYHRTVWLSLCLVAFGLAVIRRWPAAWIILICIITIEIVSMRAHQTVLGRPFRPLSPSFYNKFSRHPLLQIVPNPGTFGIYTHTPDNLRLTVNSGKVTNAAHISTYGGSTTYETVRDAATWPSVLSGLLGKNFVVDNHGVPGYSTVEHIVQASFDFRTEPPRCALFYVGWNDLRSSHTRDLKPDYSNFHLRNRGRSYGLGPASNLIVRRSAFFSILSTLFSGQSTAKGVLDPKYDPLLSQIFRDNIRLISAIANNFGVKPIFIPQLLNYSLILRHSDDSSWRIWMPFVPSAEARKLMGAMNSDLREAARESQATYLGEVLAAEWTGSDFIDSGHFSEAGSRKFATLIAKRVADECAPIGE